MIRELENLIEDTDDAIVRHNRIIEELILKRYVLISQKQSLEMDEVIECIIESGIPPKKLMDFVIAEAGKETSDTGIQVS